MKSEQNKNELDTDTKVLNKRACFKQNLHYLLRFCVSIKPFCFCHIIIEKFKF